MNNLKNLKTWTVLKLKDGKTPWEYVSPIYSKYPKTNHFINLFREKNNTRRMKTWIKIVAGIIGGTAIIASLGGFKRNKPQEQQTSYDVEELPDDILDGNNIQVPQTPQRRGERIRRETEQNVRGLQDGLTRASNILGHISIICNSVVKMCYEEPTIRITPTTYIY